MGKQLAAASVNVKARLATIRSRLRRSCEKRTVLVGALQARPQHALASIWSRLRRSYTRRARRGRIGARPPPTIDQESTLGRFAPAKRFDQ
jgi:hypothetical protein